MINTTIRAEMHVANVTTVEDASPDWTQQNPVSHKTGERVLLLSAVAGNPGAAGAQVERLDVTVLDSALWGQIKPGDKFVVEFSPVGV